jgi:hypothetical protein
MCRLVYVSDPYQKSMSAELDFESQAWEESRAAANQVETPAVEESAAVEEPEVAAAHTDETQEEAQETQEEAVEQPEEVTEAPDDDFQDLLDDLPSREQIDAKWNRIPEAARGAMSEFVEQTRTLRDSISKLGGEEAIPIFEPVKNLLSSADPDAVQTSTAYASMFQANPKASARMVVDAASHFMRSEEAGFKDVGDAIARDVFGVDVKHIQGLIQLEKAGFVNLEEDLPAVMENGSTLFQQQQSELQKAQDEIKKLQEQIRNPEKLISTTEANAEADFEKNFGTRVDTAIKPFVDRARWTGAAKLTEIVKDSILAGLRNEPEYKDVVKHVRQAGFNGEKLSFAESQAIKSLESKAKARFELAMKGINADFKAIAGSSRNAQAKEKADKETKPANIHLVPQQKQGFSTKYVDPMDAIEEAAFKESGLRAAG